MKTTRLYYQDSYLAEFSAHVVDRAEDGCRIYLDRTAFYPASGGQPFDTGEIAGVAVVQVIDEDRRIAHLTSEPVETVQVECRVDWGRRFDHMQQHTGQHLLSAVLSELYGLETVSFHLGCETSTIDVEAPALEADQLATVERRANQRITENLPVSVAFEEGTRRLVSIQGLDRNPCGGTHVRATGEIGLILIRKLDKVRGNVRIEFLCGGRAVRRARSDFDALSRVAKVLSSPLDEAPALVAAQRLSLEASERARHRLGAELARLRGWELYQATAPGADGIRRAIQRRASGPLDDESRAMAQGFTAQSKAVYILASDEPPAVLLAVSADAGIHAGDRLKSAIATAGGRGGGNALLAQGSACTKEKLDVVLFGLSTQG